MRNNIDLIITGNFVTMDPAAPMATAVGINQGKIIEIGDRSELLRNAMADVEVLLLDGKTIIPGFIDSHCHPVMAGATLASIDLRDADSVDDVLARIKLKAEALADGELIHASGFDYSTIKENRMVSLQELNEVTGDHPAIIQVYDCHSAMANTLMLNKMNLPETEGFIKDKGGNPTGLIEDPLVTMAYPYIYPNDPEGVIKTVKIFTDAAISEGVTSIHAKEFPEIIKIIDKNQSKFLLRIHPIAFFVPENLDKLQETLKATNRHTIGILADGAPDSETAAYIAPYPSDQENFGTLIYTREELLEFSKAVNSSKHQLSIHACGNRAIELILDVLEEVVKNRDSDHRYRIEHFENPLPEQIKRASALKLVVPMQPQFINISGEDNYPEYFKSTVGAENYSSFFCFKSILDEGIVVGGGSDAPIAPCSPIEGIHWAVNNVINPEQNISVYDAIKMYTLGSAFCGFEEKIKGSIEVGKLADFAVLSENPFTISKETIKNIKIEKTIVGGKVVFSNTNQ